MGQMYTKQNCATCRYFRRKLRIPSVSSFQKHFFPLAVLLFSPSTPFLSLISAEISQRCASDGETRTATFDLGEIAARARFAAKAAATVSRLLAAEIESIRGQRYFFFCRVIYGVVNGGDGDGDNAPWVIADHCALLANCVHRYYLRLRH